MPEQDALNPPARLFAAPEPRLQAAPRAAPALRPRTAVQWSALGKGVGLALLLWPAAVLAQQILLLGTAAMLAAIFGAAADNYRLTGAGDSIYSGLVLTMLGGAQPVGLALSGAAGQALENALPHIFLSASALGKGRLLGAVFTSGSSAVGVQAVQVLANALMAAVGVGALVLCCAGPWRSRLGRTIAQSTLVRVVAILLVACGAGAELELPWGNGSGGELALSMVATKVLNIDSATYDAAIWHGARVSAALNLSVVAAATVLGIVVALPLVRLRLHAGSVARLWTGAAQYRNWLLVLPLGVLLALVAGLPTSGKSLQTQPATAFEPSLANVPAPAIVVTDSLAAVGAAQTAVAPRGPSVVTVTARPGGFDFRVNGLVQGVRGIGYNPITKGQTQDQRAAVYGRDFAAMHAMGANTITGWDDTEFDGVLLDQAAKNGMGVILPLTLPPAAAYEDPAVRAQLQTAMIDRALRYKDSPGLSMWGLGNEVIHDMPADQRLKRGPVFAAFLLDTADKIHALDPNHPIVYRDAEDVYVPPLASALQASKTARPWFIYGMNFFTNRLEDALTKGPTSKLGQPLLISEFAPVGLLPGAKPTGYDRLWTVIRSHSATVLGGCVYVWSAAGPEPLDRGFGITDGNGQPVDLSVFKLASLFLPERDAELAAVPIPRSNS